MNRLDYMIQLLYSKGTGNRRVTRKYGIRFLRSQSLKQLAELYNKECI